MLELRDAQCYGCKMSDQVPVSVGDVVIHDEGNPKEFWILAHVKDLVIGKDGLTRGAIFRVASTEHKSRNVTPIAAALSSGGKNSNIGQVRREA